MQENYNTKEHWDKIWSVSRPHVDSREFLCKMTTFAIDAKYWKEVVRQPGKITEMYSMYRAWWHAYQLKPKSVLDVGCGNGRLLYGIKCLLPDCELYGVDISEAGIKHMKEVYGIDGKVMNVDDLDKLERQFDMVIVNDVFEHVEDDQKFLLKCKNKIKSTGYFYAALPNNILPPEKELTHFRTYTPESVRKLFGRHFNNYYEDIITIHIMVLVRNMWFSQNKEEKYITRFFKNKPVGNVLDIGANDGMTLSNTLKLIELGWGGLLVEPSPTAFDRLVELHMDNPKVHLSKIAVANEDGDCILHESGHLATNRFKKQDVSLISTIKKEELNRWHKWNIEWKEVPVETWTFKTLLERSPIKKFEFINVDAEGMDWDILKQMDLDALGCQLICLELVKKKNLADFRQFVEYLNPRGFYEYQRTADNILFAKK